MYPKITKHDQFGFDWGSEAIQALEYCSVATHGSQDTRCESTVHSPLHQTHRQLVVMRQIQLEEPSRLIVLCAFNVDSTSTLPALIIARRHILDTRTTGCAERVRQAKFSRNLGDRQLCFGMIDLVDADGCEANGRGNLVAEQCCCRGAFVDVD